MPRHERNRKPDSNRRAMLMGVGAGATGALAGCIGDDDDVGDVDLEETDPEAPIIDDDDDNDLPEELLPEDVFIEDQEMRILTGINPAEAHFVWLPGGMIEEYNQENKYYATAMEPGVWDRCWHQMFWGAYSGGPLGFYESIEIEEDTITGVIHEDATWSDGEPMKAKDAVATLAMWHPPPHEEHGWDHPPDLARVFNGMVKYYSVPDGMDGKVFQWHHNDHPGWEDVGGFKSVSEGEVYRWMGGTTSAGGIRNGPSFPSHVDLWEDVVDERIEQWDELDPDLDSRVPFLQDHVDNEMAEASREIGTVPSSGVWTLSEIVGTEELILEPNEQHRHVDELNYDRVVIEYSEDAVRTRAGLQAGRYDFGGAEAGPETVAEMPGKYLQVRGPANVGYLLGVDHAGLFADVEVRQAMMHAIDSPAIAENINPEATVGIDIPGWDVWFADTVLDESWVQENLIDYSQDLDRAAERMQEAGYSRGGDDLWERDGEPLQTIIATSDADPRMELTVESQLNEFGFDLNVQTFEGATFNERMHGSEEIDFIENPDEAQGDFDIWRGRFGAALAWELWALFRNGLEYAPRMRAYNIFPHEQQEEVIANHYLGSGWSEAQYPVFDELLIELPPIGQPDAEPTEEFNPMYTGILAGIFVGYAGYDDPQLDNPYYNPPHDEPHEENAEYFWQQFAWLWNWYLPALPMALAQNQFFVNTENWLWTRDHEMWDFLGVSGSEANVIAMNEVFGDPQSPKEGANVIER